MELARLEKGVAAISQSDWLEPILSKIDEYKVKNEVVQGKKKRDDKPEKVNTEILSDSLMNCIMTKEIYRKGDRVDVQKLRDKVLKSGLDTAIKCDFIDYINVGKDEAVRSLRTLVYDFFNAEKAVERSKKCGDISTWVHSVADKLSPEIKGYSKRQIDLVIALIIYELTLRNTEYNDLFCRFTEVYKLKGGVY